MLRRIGVGDVEDAARRTSPPRRGSSRPAQPPAALAEIELLAHLRALAAQNARRRRRYASLPRAPAPTTTTSRASIDHLLLRGEFFTAYTPYQPEVEPGHAAGRSSSTRRMICELTGHGRRERVDVRRRARRWPRRR